MYAKIFLISLCLIAAWYLITIFIFTLGWFRMKTFMSTKRNIQTRLSVVVAYRNEARMLPLLIKDLLSQTYPSEQWELVLVNDHSEDDGFVIVKKLIDDQIKIPVKMIDAVGQGKKQALLEGIKQASGSLIVSTDADCRLHPNWLSKLVAFYEQEKPIMMLGPVVYSNEKSVLQKFFSLDFMSLVVSGAGSMAMNLPLMGNGANLAFEKDAFLEAGAEAQQQNYASGDDVFLMHYLFKKYGTQSVRFIKNKECQVQTPAPETLHDFLHQRIRWGSKAKGYQLFWPVMVSLMVFLFNTLVATTFFISFFSPWFIIIYFMFIFLKFLIDLPMIQAYSEFSNKKSIVIYLLPFEIIYPFYIVYTAIFAIFSTFEWKGRKSLH